MPELLPLYAVDRRHLDHLTTDLGIAQHATGADPDRDRGTCTDDVARALMVDLLHARELGWEHVEASAARNVAYLDSAFDGVEGRFRNVRSHEGSWLDPVGSEGANARALEGLGEAIATCPPGAVREAATALFLRALPTVSKVAGLRPRATVLLACDAAERGGLAGEVPEVYQRVGNDLRLAFESRTVTFDWPWPEDTITAESELPARALIVGGKRLGYPRMARAGFRILDWLIDAQTSSEGYLSTVGSAGWWPRGGQAAPFDQRPVSATALLLAADTAFAASGTPRYRAAMEMAYGWFLGRNVAGAAVADPLTGSGHDGIGPHGVSPDQGAESTLMWLMAVERIRALRAGSTTTAPLTSLGSLASVS